jgi:hypothetical protein
MHYLTLSGPIHAMPESQKGTLNEIDPDMETKKVKTVETILLAPDQRIISISFLLPRDSRNREPKRVRERTQQDPDRFSPRNLCPDGNNKLKVGSSGRLEPDSNVDQ